MTISNVRILNWSSPGSAYWERVAANPDDPLIDADISVTLSHREYHELLARDKAAQKLAVETGLAKP